MRTHFAAHQSVRHHRLVQKHRHDTNKANHKTSEPTVCPQCGAVFHEERWQWAPRPAKAREEVCPACHRIHDEFPAGFVSIGGPFFVEHREDLLHLVWNDEARAKAEHPLERIIQTVEQENGILITTTETHLAWRIGESLQHIYDGKLEFHYNEQENLLRVAWER